ncbi:MAG: glycosyltransferase family 4 protein [Alphaproteobacteria bacterium]|nr:glycosyltransferase family 4 protein [Alphaproteobacteria bacterium]MDE2630228.1 glycosyltransferase family 4 protein [Alphaproteobacteria bacterium]
MKLLYLNPDRGIPVLGDKGASVHVREFVTALAHQGHEVALICASLGEGNSPPPVRLIEIPPDPDEFLLERECMARFLPVTALEDRVLRRELGRLSYDRGFCRRVRAALDGIDFRPDAIYERYALFHCAGAALAQMLAVPRLLEVNAPLIREQEQFRGLVLKSVAAASECASFHGANSIIAVSEEVAAYVASCGIPREGILTIPNGVDTTHFHPDAGGEAVRRKLGLGADPVVGFIGSFKPWHGVDFLIDAFATMARQHRGVRLLCVGEGPELEAAKEGIAAQGLEDRAVFSGRIPHAEIPSYLAAMDISVAPYLTRSDFYFSPLKVVESLAAGTPVIAPRIGQLELLVDHGKTGLLFTPGDAADFIAKTLDLVRDPARRRTMSAAARAHALSDFSWQRAAGRVIDEAQRHIDTMCAA